jgi:hypothetical protein
MKTIMGYGLAGLTAIIVGCIAYVFLWGRWPVSSEWLTQNLRELDMGGVDPIAAEAMEQVLGGGHFYLRDGRDLWMRFKVTPDAPADALAELDTFVPDFATSLQCTPAEQEIVTSWFRRAVSRPIALSWLTPWSELGAMDQASLEDTENLDCIFSDLVPLQSVFQEGGCGSWWLRHRQTGFIYVRTSCYN